MAIKVMCNDDKHPGIKKAILYHHPLVSLQEEHKNDKGLWILTYEPDKDAPAVTATAVNKGAITAGNF